MSKRRAGTNWQYGRALEAATSIALRHYNDYTRTRTETKRQQQPMANGVTQQFDSRVQYRRHQGKKSDRAKWMRFMKKVQDANLATSATKTVIFNDSATAGNATGLQAVYGVNIYSFKTASAVAPDWNRDMARIMYNDPIPGGVASGVQQRQYVFKSAVLDVTFSVTPASYSGTAPDIIVTPYAKAEIDVYEVAYKQDCNGETLQQLWTDALLATPKQGTLGSDITPVTLGATPFQSPELCRQVTILKKTKYFMEPGECATYQKRYPGNRHLTKSFVMDEISMPTYAVAGQTQTLLFVIKGVPTKTTANVIESSPMTNIVISATRTYSYSFLDSGEQTADAANP